MYKLPVLFLLVVSLGLSVSQINAAVERGQFDVIGLTMASKAVSLENRND